MATKLTVSFVPLKRNVTKIGVRFFPEIENDFGPKEEEFEEEEFEFDEFEDFEWDDDDEESGDDELEDED